MRLYRLLSRHGARKARPWPWFEPPEAGAPVKYVGWNWDPASKEWVQVDIPKMEVVVKVPKYPMPAEPPRAATPKHVPGWDWSDMYECWEKVPLTRKEGAEGIAPGPEPMYVPTEGTPADVEGWSWSETDGEWVATTVIGQKVEFQPPPTLPPGVDFDKVFTAGPMSDLNLRMIKWAMANGLSYGDAVGFAARAMEDFAGWGKNMTPQVYRALWARYAVGLWDRVGSYTVHKSYRLTVQMAKSRAEGNEQWMEMLTLGILVLVATAIGAAIGMIMEDITFVDEPSFMMPEPIGTYLMGPDDWFYSRNIGVSPQGNMYYSKCQGIGTEYVRHKRGAGKSLYDTIDFPGGFPEEGYQFPHWVKYTWSHWDIVYVGMMYSSSELVYVLKKEYISLEERSRRVTVRPSEEWCTNFHWYL